MLQFTLQYIVVIFRNFYFSVDRTLGIRTQIETAKTIKNSQQNPKDLSIYDLH